MAEDMERLTNNSAILTSSDLIYVSRIMKNIAQSPRVTTKVTAESVKLGYFLMCQQNSTIKNEVHFCFHADQQKNAENCQ